MTDTLCSEGRCFSSPFRSKNFDSASLLVLCAFSVSCLPSFTEREKRNGFTEYSELEGTHKDLTSSILELAVHPPSSKEDLLSLLLPFSKNGTSFNLCQSIPKKILVIF